MKERYVKRNTEQKQEQELSMTQLIKLTIPKPTQKRSPIKSAIKKLTTRGIRLIRGKSQPRR